MRILNKGDISNLGPSAKRQVEKVLSEQGGFNNSRRANNPEQFGKKGAGTPVLDSKKKKPSRVMRTHDGLSYCPWPVSDPFVNLHKKLEKKYGLYENGGMLLTELIVEGGGKNWRFDFALVSPFKKTKVTGEKTELEMFLGYTCLIHVNLRMLQKVLQSMKISASSVVTLFAMLHAKMASKNEKVLQGEWVCA